MIRQTLQAALSEALRSSAPALGISEADAAGALGLLNIERPRQGNFGDYAVNVSPLAKLARKAPPQIAATIADQLKSDLWETAIVGGFLNFQLSDKFLAQALVDLVHTESPGQNTAYADLSCLMEFVSANPTGPLHIGHGRWVALGDSLGRLMKHSGARVHNEFYVNDAGSQMNNIANSIWYRALEILGTGATFPTPEEGKPFPFYPAEYVIEMAQGYLAEPGNTEALKQWDTPDHSAPPEALASLGEHARVTMRARQEALMTRCGLTFDTWTSERTLHEAGKVKEAIADLTACGKTFEKDGALWFASTEYGDDQDRVLIKSDGSYTYLTADIAYHRDKFDRDGGAYTCIMNIWGADHHGYMARMKAAMAALGEDPGRLEILLGQLVNLIVDGERTRMGKRRKMLTLDDLVEEVGVDAVRFWMVSKSQDTALDFDVELAASSSDENPVFYVQYAHARCESIYRNAFQPRLDTVSQVEKPALLEESAFGQRLGSLTADGMLPLFAGLENEAAQTAIRELILKLDAMEDKVVEAVRQRSPHIIARYTQDVAAEFHRFYNVCRILTPDAETTQLRLPVVIALKRVLAQSLHLLGVSAPERM